jgi:hypothetical protein
MKTFLKRAGALVFGALMTISASADPQLKLNALGYFEAPGLNVTVFADIYPDGHQTGVTVIQHGVRVANFRGFKACTVALKARPPPSAMVWFSSRWSST